ncbi:MAG: copper resistance CopC family protein [Rubrobacteraceae bacterium]
MGAGKSGLAAFTSLSLLWVLLLCAPAFAHASLVEAEPADGASLERAPEEVRLAFNEPVEAAFSPVEVYGSGGGRVDLDDARVDPDDARVVVVGLEDLSEGAYTVEWRVTSVDGHVVDGKYKFSVSADDSGGSTNTVPDEEEAREEPEPREESSEGQEADRVGLYSVKGVGVVGFAALALLVVSALRRRG